MNYPLNCAHPKNTEIKDEIWKWIYDLQPWVSGALSNYGYFLACLLTLLQTCLRSLTHKVLSVTWPSRDHVTRLPQKLQTVTLPAGQARCYQVLIVICKAFHLDRAFPIQIFSTACSRSFENASHREGHAPRHSVLESSQVLCFPIGELCNDIFLLPADSRYPPVRPHLLYP